MDFFERQHVAKRTTFILVVLFMLVCAALVLAIMFVASQFARFDDNVFIKVDAATNMLHPWSLTAGIVTLGIIMVGACIEWVRLGKGGHALARRLGAKRIFKPTTKHAQDALNSAITNDAHIPKTASNSTHLALERKEKQLLAAVENMAIASGMSEPAVYVLTHEAGINAFVAGFKAHDMVLVVTRGALEQLTESELYGIIGHEFSHIAHGDTKLNLRLLIMLGGLQLIHEVSGFIFTLGSSSDDSYGGYGGSDTADSYGNTRWGSDIFFGRGSGKDKDGDGIGGAPLVILFLFLVFCLSSIGVFAARLIKYATLRQREYLADAASVQYTRSFGVLDALVKIRDVPMHGSIYHPSRQALSHLFFASSLPNTDVFAGVFSTHPPLDKRIRALSENTFNRIKAEDEIRRTEAQALAARRSEAYKRFAKERLFEYKEPSDYDGTPLEFTPSGSQPPQLMSKTNAKAGAPHAASALANQVQLSPLVDVAEVDAASQFALQNAAIDALPLRAAKAEASKKGVPYQKTAHPKTTVPSNKTVPKFNTQQGTAKSSAPKKPSEAVDFSATSKPSIALHATNIAGFERNSKAGRLIHDALSKPKGALEIIAASLAHHQQRTSIIETFRPEDYEVSRTLYAAMQKQAKAGAIDEIALITAAIDHLPKLDTRVRKPAALAYLDRLRRIISLDGKISLLEHLLLERVAYKFGLLSELYALKDVQKNEVHAACIKLIYGILHADAHSKQDLNRIALRLCRLLGLPSKENELKPLIGLAAQLNLSQCLSVLSVQTMLDKTNILDTLKTAMLADGHLNDDEAAIIAQLTWRLT